MKAINMTGHMLTIGDKIIEPDGCLRASFAFFEKEEQFDGLRVFKTLKSCDDSIIPPQDGVIYIVSDKVCRALPDRPDLYIVHGIKVDPHTKHITSSKGIKRNTYYTGN